MKPCDIAEQLLKEAELLFTSMNSTFYNGVKYYLVTREQAEEFLHDLSQGLLDILHLI